MDIRQVRAMASRAMQAPDTIALEIKYRSRDGSVTKRWISPMRFEGQDRILALCLCREQPRAFELDGVIDCKEVESNDLLMPMPIEELEVADGGE